MYRSASLMYYSNARPRTLLSCTANVAVYFPVVPPSDTLHLEISVNSGGGGGGGGVRKTQRLLCITISI